MTEPNLSDHENDRRLEDMLDSMLSAYSAAEPRPGLETRIVASLREHSAGRARLWNFRWMWGGVALASAALILLLIHFSRLQQQPPTAPQLATRPQQQEAPAADAQKDILSPSVVASGHSRRHKARIARATDAQKQYPVEVRQEVFPSPSPLSEQEKLLLQYLARTPRAEIIAQSHPDPQDEDEENDLRNSRPENLTQVLQKSSNTR
jgi:hypothetical protein